MEPVIEREAALVEIAGWESHFEVELDKELRESLLPAVMRGRIIFDSASEKFKVLFRSPIPLENGQSLADITLREPTAKEMVDSDKGNEMDMTLRAISNCSGQPLGVIERLRSKDLIVLSGVLGFFG